MSSAGHPMFRDRMGRAEESGGVRGDQSQWVREGSVISAWEAEEEATRWPPGRALLARKQA